MDINLDFIYGHLPYWLFIILMLSGLFIVVSRGNLIKKIVGLNIFQTSVFMFYISIGKITGGTAPILLDKKGNELLRIIVVISENDPVNTTKLFEHTFKRTYDPADRFDKMNKF